MLSEKIVLDKYDWTIYAYYHITKYNIEEITDKLVSVGCKGEILKDAKEHMSASKLNTGLTYTNGNKRCSIVVVSKASEPAQFINSISHETFHVVSHIIKSENIDFLSEEAAYLYGDLAQRLYDKVKPLICKCHSK